MSTVQESLSRIQTAAEQDATGDPAAHTTLLQEINNLRDLAETPADRLMRMRFHYLENLCIRVALELKILQAIAVKRGSFVTAAELSKDLDIDELLIVRVMRLVTYTRVVDEVGPSTYASNDTTTLVTSPGGIGGEKHHTDLGFAVGSRLIEMIRKGKFHMFGDEENLPSPFEYTYGKPIFEYLPHDKEQKEAFDEYMAIRRAAGALEWFETYPAKQELKKEGLRTGEDAVLVVDVGGGVGHEIGKFREAFGGSLPGRLILQDLPETFAQTSGPEAVEVIHHDFFTTQPIKGAKIYYLRQIMHDWSPKKCSQILSNLVKAMDPQYSRILIDDYLLPDTGADRRAAAMDFLMFVFAQGMERSKGQWEDLLDGVGLEIVKIWRGETGLECVIEAKVKS